MNRVSIRPVLLVLAVSGVAVAQSTNPVAEKVVRDGIAAYIDGAVNCKADVLDRLFAPEFIMIHGAGGTTDKAGLVTLFTKCASDTARMTIEPKTTKMYGDIVIMTGELNRYTRAGWIDGPFLI